eukprot:scaffold41187_cov303-Isochrysis_galbana.AAC.3
MSGPARCRRFGHGAATGHHMELASGARFGSWCLGSRVKAAGARSHIRHKSNEPCRLAGCQMYCHHSLAEISRLTNVRVSRIAMYTNNTHTTPPKFHKIVYRSPHDASGEVEWSMSNVHGHGHGRWSTTILAQSGTCGLWLWAVLLL